MNRLIKCNARQLRRILSPILSLRTTYTQESLGENPSSLTSIRSHRTIKTSATTSSTSERGTHREAHLQTHGFQRSYKISNDSSTHVSWQISASVAPPRSPKFIAPRLPLPQTDHLVAGFPDGPVVGGDEDRRPTLRQSSQMPDHRLRVLGVEGPGWFIR